MREILFRGKTTKKEIETQAFNNVWVEGDLIENKDKYYIHPKANSFKIENELTKIMVAHEVITESVGEYVGLDKKGNRIFEGDIVKDIYTSKTYKVEFTDYGTIYPFVYYSDCENFEVIGNIYDNKELLGE